MVVIDQFTRRIIGFAVQTGECDGVSYCRMFNKIISEKLPPKYLSSDNDPLFEFHQWKANLRILEVNEIKSVPGVPTSYPFVERIIGSVRREYLDRIFFFNQRDLQNKLNHFKNYYNGIRGHSSLEMKTPKKYHRKQILRRTLSLSAIFAGNLTAKICINYRVLPGFNISHRTGMIYCQ